MPAPPPRKPEASGAEGGAGGGVKPTAPRAKFTVKPRITVQTKRPAAQAAAPAPPRAAASPAAADAGGPSLAGLLGGYNSSASDATP